MLGVLRTLAVFAIAVIATLFFVQNLAATEVAFLTWSVSAPRALVFASIFLLGLAMGVLLISLRPRRKPKAAAAVADQGSWGANAPPGERP